MVRRMFWRMGLGYIGWAPLPPGVGWQPGIGLELGRIDLDREIPSGRWVFVQDRFFAEPRLRDHVLLSFQSATVFPNTRVVAGLQVVGGNIFDVGVSVARVESAAGHRISHFRLGSVDSVAAARRLRPRCKATP